MPNNDLQKQLSKLRRDKKLLWLGVLFFVLVVLWILVGIFATTKTSSITPVQRELAKSFIPRLESKVFEDIAQKQVYDEGVLGLFPIYVLEQNQQGGTNKVDIMAELTTVDPAELSEAVDQIKESLVATPAATTSTELSENAASPVVDDDIVGNSAGAADVAETDQP